MHKTITFTIQTTGLTDDIIPIAYDSACDLLKHLLNDQRIESATEKLYDEHTPSVVKPTITVSVVSID